MKGVFLGVLLRKSSPVLFNLKGNHYLNLCQQFIESNISRSIQCVFNNRNFHHTILKKNDPTCTKYFLHRDINLTNLRPVEYDVLNLRFMAGHSKWQNIKHIKAAKDSAKSFWCNKYCSKIRYAVKEGGSDPKSNHKLALLLEECRDNNIPNSTVENALKRASSGKIKTGLIEIGGPGGCYVVIDYETDNISTMRHSIKFICKKYQSNIIQGEGRWRAFYERKGILLATKTADDKPLDAEKALEAAIEAGSEDVQYKLDEEEKPYLEFYCDSAELFTVKKSLEDLSYLLDDVYVGYIAHVTVQLKGKDMEAAGNLISELGEMQEVVRLYENVQ